MDFFQSLSCSLLLQERPLSVPTVSIEEAEKVRALISHCDSGGPGWVCLSETYSCLRQTLTTLHQVDKDIEMSLRADHNVWGEREDGGGEGPGERCQKRKSI
jgi:hypothetical protein